MAKVLMSLSKSRDPAESWKEPPTSNRAYGYVRVSPVDVSSERYSVAAQSSFIRRWVEAQSLDLVNIFTDMCNMETSWDKRPALVELLTTIMPGETFVMLDLTRLMGSQADYLHVYDDCVRRHYRFATVLDNLDTKAAFGNFAVVQLALVFEMLEDMATAQKDEARQIEELRQK